MDVINENQELTFNMNSYPIISNQTLTDFPARLNLFLLIEFSKLLE
jgi:hypothetical protein